MTFSIVADMMDETLTEQHRELRQVVRKFADEVVRPRIDDYEHSGQYPIEVAQEIAARGYLGAIVAQEYGGLGLDYLSYGIIVEELARADRTTASLVHVQNSLICACLATFGDHDQKVRYLPRLAAGEWLSAACFTEPDVGSDLASVKASVRRNDNESYLLNGEKIFVSHGAVADLLYVLASTGPSAGKAGTVALLVEREWPGIEVEVIPMRMLRRQTLSRITFTDVRVPFSNRLEGEGDGLRVSGANLDVGRFSVGAQALGQAQRALDVALEWSVQRQQFGRPIGQFQMLQQKLADMLMSVDAARHAVYRVARLKDAGVARVSTQAAMAKCYASETATRVALDAIQILGTRGLSEEFDIGRIPLESKGLEIAEGSNQIQRKLIAEYALGFREY